LSQFLGHYCTSETQDFSVLLNLFPDRFYLFFRFAQRCLKLTYKNVAIDIYRAVLENNASEQSARMIAMRNSTDNANELIDDLTLVYNKTRQANITREMIEIASGAEALGG
jgi:hypothetical protein